jgi:hypothetical protein
MGRLSFRKFVLADTASREKLVGLFAILHLELAIKFVFLEVFKLERGFTSSFLIVAKVLDFIDHFKKDWIRRHVLSLRLVTVWT